MITTPIKDSHLILSEDHTRGGADATACRNKGWCKGLRFALIEHPVSEADEETRSSDMFYGVGKDKARLGSRKQARGKVNVSEEL